MALLVAGYAVGLGGMILTRGIYLTPDRYFLILLVPALFLGIARRYVLDFLPLIALIIVYEELRGVAHILRPDPYYAPQLDIDRFLFGGTVPSVWLQERLWDGTLSPWEAGLSFLQKMHFIVPPTLLFLIWLRRRELYYRLAATMIGISFVAALTYALWPAAPPWMAYRDGWIGEITKIGAQGLPGTHGGGDSLIPSTRSWIFERIDDNPSAAVPSLHAGYACLVLLFALAAWRRWGAVAILYALPMWFTIVYFGDHYVSDALIGIAYAIGGFLLVRRLWPSSPLAGPYEPPLARARGAPGRSAVPGVRPPIEPGRVGRPV